MRCTLMQQIILCIKQVCRPLHLVILLIPHLVIHQFIGNFGLAATLDSACLLLLRGADSDVAVGVVGFVWGLRLYVTGDM